MPQRNDSEHQDGHPLTNIVCIDGLKIRYETSGAGHPLILMHGWGCRLETVRMIAATAAMTNTVYNIDMPGFGESDEPGEIWGVDRYTCFIEAFCRHFSIENPVLIGHSFGGRVAILYSSRNPSRGVVLVDAAGVKPLRPLSYYIKVYSFKSSKGLIRLVLPRAKADRIIENMRNKRGSADYRDSSSMMRAILSRVVNEDLTHVMPLIKAPVLLIWGEKDTATPLRDAKIMEKLIPDTGLVVIESAGHYSFLDNPGLFKAVLASFLKSLSP